MAESMKHHVETIKNELARLKAKVAEDQKNGVAGTISGLAVPGGAEMVVAVAGGAGVGSAATGGAGTPGIVNEEVRPLDVVANEIQRVAKEIELATGLTSASSTVNDNNEADKPEDKSKKKEGYEPKKKKEKNEKNGEEDHDHDNGPPPPLGA